MATADLLLSRLGKVKASGSGKWMACCPAHQDRSASLSVREVEDGRILVHCFAGCSVDEVLRAVGLDLADLFPPRTGDEGRPSKLRRPFIAADAIRALRRELLVAWLILADVAAGKPLTDQDRKRAGLARDRCIALISELGGD